MTANDPLPIESLFGSPAFSRAQISPDGTRVAYLAPWRSRQNIWVRRIAAGLEQEDKRRLTADNVQNIDGF